ncbi:MAG: EscU/YscU/HrcU family type III secretion system export apparatus switch protein [Desulfuromonadales bacterium]|nr:EscU/YscU/HrcU family type III secretion system export apparatus switch protein [Desulfuromonadales bacterium]MBN2792077.1 EscU/YscU/HrcU family type III secretion system export apparatus switch protein [Desulfuromonadales bacterium]
MTDKNHSNPQAVALHFEPETDAIPRVLASGRGDIARQIIAAARAAGVDIVEDPDLLEVLGRVPVGEDIPPELFQAVAEILAFIYRLNGRYEASQNV